MYSVKVTLKGIVPIKFNRPLIEELAGLDDGTRPGGRKTKEQKLEDWKRKILSDDNGYYVENIMLKECIVKGLALPFPLVSNKVKMQKPKAKATIFIEDYKNYIDGKLDKEPDISYTQNKNAPGCPLVCVRRPIMQKWGVSFQINVVDEYLLEEVLRDGVARAGLCHGLGSHRPDFGRFVIEKWEKI
jgi:hypothetical protein